MNRIFRIALFAIICFLCSCERRPLVDVQAMTKVRVVLNTDDIPNVTTGIYNEKIVAELTIPEIFRVIFYDRKNNEIVSQEFITRKGIGLDGMDANLQIGAVDALDLLRIPHIGQLAVLIHIARQAGILGAHGAVKEEEVLPGQGPPPVVVLHA